MRTNKEMLSHIDHTLLKATATKDDIKQLCEEAIKYETAGVCIPSCWVYDMHRAFPELNICTVVGFPLGNSNTATKIEEAKRAIKAGANEIDMVINIGWLKSGMYGSVIDEIQAVKDYIGNHILKVIVETCYLTEEEKKKICEYVSATDADYIKTSTGFGTNGATLEDIRLFKKYIDPRLKIKAAGGINTKDMLAAFLDEGCDRIGSSSLVKILKED